MKASTPRWTVKLIMIALLLALLSTSALAIGVAPSKRIFDYKPGETVSYGIDIVNNGKEDLEVLLYARGDLSENVKLDKQMLTLSSDENSKTVNVEFTMPDSVDTAGSHELDIVAVGTTPAPDGAGSVVKADIAVISKLVFDVPYPEKYIEARVHVLDTQAGKPVQLSMPVFNKGTVDIESLHAEVEIFDAAGKKVAEAVTEGVALKKGKNTKLTASTAEGLAVGAYEAVATVHYDGDTREARVKFNVGELSLQVRSLVVDKFSLGGVAKFDILLYNQWSDDLRNVYADMQITGPDNKVYSEFKTVAVDIGSKQVGRLEGYWYTEGVASGVYTAKVTLHYANKISQKLFELDVYPDRIVAREVGVTGKAISSSEELDLRNNAFLILVIVVMGIVIAVLVYKLRKRGGGASGKKADTAAAGNAGKAANPSKEMIDKGRLKNVPTSSGRTDMRKGVSADRVGIKPLPHTTAGKIQKSVAAKPEGAGAKSADSAGNKKE